MSPHHTLFISMEHKANHKNSKVNPLVINAYGPVLDYQAKVSGDTHLANALTISKHEEVLTQTLRLMSCVPLL